jgi:hypothetical protein
MIPLLKGWIEVGGRCADLESRGRPAGEDRREAIRVIVAEGRRRRPITNGDDIAVVEVVVEMPLAISVTASGFA